MSSPDQHDVPPAPIEDAQVRRVPRYGVFLALGAGLGIVLALVLTFVFDGTGEKSPFTNLQYSQGQVFGFLLLFCIPIGIAIGGVVALILDRTVGRRRRSVRISHERIRTPDDE